MISVLMIMTGGLRRDGISITQLEYIKHIDKKNVSIDVLAVNNNDRSIINEYKECGCNVIVMPSRVNNICKYIINLYRLIKINNYNAIHVHGSSTLMGIELMTAKYLSVPIRIAHSRNTYTKHPKLDRVFRPIFEHSYTNALACGKDAGVFLFKNKPFDVFYNGKDFTKFSYKKDDRTAVRHQFDLDGNIVLGFVGTLHEQKNPMFLIEVFSKIYSVNSNYRLMIIGDGKLKNQMELYAKKMNCSSAIIFIGKSNEVNRLIQACDLMLLPSLYEGLPNVVLEWQIAGIPSLVSNKVTTECKQTLLVHFLPIDKGSDTWVNVILSYGENKNAEEQSKNACKFMLNKGFEINSSCKRLLNLYIEGKI